MKIVILAEKTIQARAYADTPIVSKNWLGKKLPKEAVLALFDGKTTEELTFKSKAGKSYKAKLQFNDEGKFQPIFSDKNKK